MEFTIWKISLLQITPVSICLPQDSTGKWKAQNLYASPDSICHNEFYFPFDSLIVLSIFHWNQVLIGDSTVSNTEQQIISSLGKKEKKEEIRETKIR